MCFFVFVAGIVLFGFVCDVLDLSVVSFVYYDNSLLGTITGTIVMMSAV